MKFKRNDNVLTLMDKILLVCDGEDPRDLANALQYCLNMVHCYGGDDDSGTGANQTVGPIPGVKRC